jgi:hypothetical protein
VWQAFTPITANKKYHLPDGVFMNVTVNEYNGLSLQVVQTGDDRQWYMTVEEVAAGYEVARNTIMTHLKNHADEIRDGIEKGVGITGTLGGPQQKTVIYREGVIKLGFFILSKKAAAFRQWATNLVCAVLDRGQVDLSLILEQISVLKSQSDRIEKQLSSLVGMSEAVYGEDASEIMQLIQANAEAYGVDGRTIWKWVRAECDVASYKRQNAKVANFLRNKLGGGLKVVPSLEGAK